MMRKTNFFSLVLAVFLVGCGEAGIQSDISKISSIAYDINAVDLNPVTGVTRGVTFNFADADFSSYVSDAERFTLNKLEFEVSDVSASPSATLDIEIRIDFNNNTASATDGDVLLTVSNVPVANTTSPVLLYSTDATNPGLANASVVQLLEQTILNRGTVEVEITTSKSGPDLTDDFIFNLLFDLTASLQLD